MRSNMIDVEVVLHGTTDKAFYISDTGDIDDAVWVPKSQCELEQNSNGKTYTLTCEEWLATEKGLT